MRSDTAFYDTILRESLSDFIQQTFLEIDPAAYYSHNWHVDLIAEYLTACYNKEIKRLIINIPPRFMKSISTSIAFPAWVLGKNPSEKVAVGSYSKTLGLDLSLNCKDVIKSPWYQRVFPETIISKSQDTKEYFKTTKKGGRYTASVGGAITGFGGNFLIVDDPHNPKQALSDVQRAAANKWYDGTLTSRLNDIKNGAIILIMQRLHESDLTGHLLERGDVEHLKIPNEFEEKTIYHFPISGREIVKTKGEYLHPDRMGKPEADKKKVELGAYNYAGQYQQRPVPLGGGEFKELWYSYYEGELDVRNMNIYIIADPANEKKKDSDYTAITVIGLAPDHNYYLLDMIRDKLNPTERVEAIFQLHRKWNAKGGKPPTVGYEKYGMQSDIHYLNLRQDETNYRFHIAELAGGMAKEDRIRRLIPAFQTKRFYFPKYLFYSDYLGERIDLIKELIKEFGHFPVGAHDDMIDAMSRIEDESLGAYFPALQDQQSHHHDDRSNSGFMGF